MPNWSGLSNIANGSTTADITPPAAIDDLQASVGTVEGSIDLSWTAPGDDSIFGKASLYEIRYSMDSITNVNWLSSNLFTTPPRPADAGVAQTATISNLTPGQVYYIGIKAYDERANISGLSNISSAEAMVSFITGVDDDEVLPDQFSLSQNYPNPFNPTTMIEFSLPEASHVELGIYNIKGEKIAVLSEGSYSAGIHSVEWDGTVAGGGLAATGVYFYRMQADNFNESKKMVLLK